MTYRYLVRYMSDRSEGSSDRSEKWTRDPSEAATTAVAWAGESDRDVLIRVEGELRAVPNDGGVSAKMDLFEVTPGRSASEVFAEIRQRLEC